MNAKSLILEIVRKIMLMDFKNIVYDTSFNEIITHSKDIYSTL